MHEFYVYILREGLSPHFRLLECESRGSLTLARALCTYDAF